MHSRLGCYLQKQNSTSLACPYEDTLCSLAAVCWKCVHGRCRLRSCEAASELLRAYRNKMDEERNWASQATVRVNAVKTARPSVDRQQALVRWPRRPRVCLLWFARCFLVGV